MALDSELTRGAAMGMGSMVFYAPPSGAVGRAERQSLLGLSAVLLVPWKEIISFTLYVLRSVSTDGYLYRTDANNRYITRSHAANAVISTNSATGVEL